MADASTGGVPVTPPRYGDWDRYTTEVVKRSVPLQWAFEHFFGVYVGAEMVSCPFPGHSDSTPSFNLWSPDDDGLPTRYGCFGCGQQGDVITLIIEQRQVSFGEACRIAIDELAPEIVTTNWVPSAVVHDRHHATPQELEDILAAYRPMTAAGFDALLGFMRRKGLGGESLERYVVEQWEWGGVIELGRTVYFPHRDWEGKLTGIKYRSALTDSRWNEDGSAFPALYGAWRDHHYQNVFIAEGETDTIAAAWSLRDQEFDVFGLGSGASQNPTDEMRERLAGRTVYICGDGDHAGALANQKWYEAGITAFIVRMPEEEDLLSCGISASELIEERSTVPRTPTPIIGVRGGKFCKLTTDEKTHEEIVQPIADFSFMPERELIMPEDAGPAWEGHLTGTPAPVVLRNQDLNDVRKFTQWANRNGARAFTGGVKDTQYIMNWVAGTASYMPLERATQKAGRVGRSYVGPEFCIGADKLRYVAPFAGNAGLSERLHIVRAQWDTQAIRALENLNDPGVMAVILGWLCASLMRGQRAPAPPLFIAGESGAGKTHLVSTVLDAFGFGIEANLTTTTPFGVDSFVSSTIGFPVWFDEYRSGARADSLERLRQILRDAFNGQSSVKGGMRTQATELSEVTTWAGIIVSGEMGTSETSLRDRLVYLELDPDSRNKTAYGWLHADPRRTRGLGYALLEYLAARPDALFRIPDIGDHELPDRFRQGMGFVQTGWDAWLGFRTAAGITDTPTGPTFQTLAATRTDTADPYIDLLRHCQGKLMRSGSGFIVEQTEAGVKLMTAEVIAEAEFARIDIPGRAHELLAWLKRRYPVEETRVDGRRGKLIVGMDLEKGVPE